MFIKKLINDDERDYVTTNGESFKCKSFNFIFKGGFVGLPLKID